jgi:hypothetical protein
MNSKSGVGTAFVKITTSTGMTSAEKVFGGLPD